jgi:hypothetical protein
VAELDGMQLPDTVQVEGSAWYEGLPDNLRDNLTAWALQAIVDLDLDALAASVPPRG